MPAGIEQIIRDHYRPLSLEEERAAVKAKDWGALVNSQLKIVVKLAADVVSRLGRDDLLEDAFAIALAEMYVMVPKYDPDRGRLTTLVMNALKHRIFRSIQPVVDTAGIKQWRRTPAGWQRTGCSAGSFVDVFGRETWDTCDQVQSGAHDRANDRIDAVELLARVDLSERERLVVSRRCFGDKLTVIARELGVSRERVRQIEAGALNKLRKAAKAA
jgi:RNA polymerase sigma factor (sigma-70 family)